MSNTSLNWALTKASKNLSIDVKTVEMVYRSYWGFIKEYISSLPIKEMSKEELESTVTNFNIPYIGKLYTNFDKVQKYRNQLNYYQNVKIKGNKTNRKSDTD